LIKPPVATTTNADANANANANANVNAALKLKEAEETKVLGMAEDQKESEKEAEKRKAKIKCRYFSKFGSSDKNDKGCKNGLKCPYLHPRLCRPALRGRCGEKKCGSHHLTAIKPPAKEIKKTTTNNHSSSSGNNNSGNNNNNNNNKPSPNPNKGQHQASWGSFLGQPSLNPQGININC
jgi:hypothetical protein